MKNLKVKNSLCKAKRFWSGFIAVIFLCFGLVSFSACGKKTDDLSKISTGLSNYDISIDFDNSTKSLTAKQKVNYVNNTDTVLKQVKFHLYPQFFKQGATDKIVSQTKMNNCYRHGMSYCEFEITKLKLADTEIAVVLEGDYNNILNVNLTNSLMPTERVDVDLEYYIKLPNCEHRFGYGDDTINLANFYPIACVYENMVAIAMANPNGDNAGCSCAFSPICWDRNGKCVDNTVLLADDKSEGILYAEFDMEAIREYRNREMLGNTFRKVEAYSQLLSKEIKKPFIRDGQNR